MSVARRQFLDRPNSWRDEPIAAYIEEGDVSLPIYEAQVVEAQRILNPFIDTVVARTEIDDRLAEHSRVVNANVLETFNELTIELLEEAFLLVDHAIDCESYTLSPVDQRPIPVSKATKAPGSFARFDAIRLRAILDKELNFVPQAEIIEIQPGPARPTVYNRIVFNPREHRIALQEIDTPAIRVS